MAITLNRKAEIISRLEKSGNSRVLSWEDAEEMAAMYGPKKQIRKEFPPQKKPKLRL
ncbi:hypothetical protein SAMN05216311_106273 [Chitinophaga sp. CF418]|nr:hypothetical protein SAMN05216311_106273 [Chitinophaga sp. CF418]